MLSTGARERFSAGLDEKSVKGMKSLSLSALRIIIVDGVATLNKSHRMDEATEKIQISVQCPNGIRTNDFTYRYHTAHLEVR